MQSRVALRPMVNGDLDELFRMMQDEESVRMAAFTPPDPADRAAFDAHMQRILDDPETIPFVIICESELVGSITAFPAAGWIPEKATPEVSFWVDRDHWGQGIATTALTQLLQRLPRPVVARAAADNLGSLRVLERLGFKQVGTDRDFAPGRGESVDEVLLQLD